MCAPQYQELLDGHIPRATPQDGVVVKVIAGVSHGVKSQIHTRMLTMLFNFKLDMNKTLTQTIRQHTLDSSTSSVAPHTSEATEAKAHHILLSSELSTSTVRIQTKDE